MKRQLIFFTKGKNPVIITAIFIASALILNWWFKVRQDILDSKWNSITQKFESKGYQLKSGKAKFSGLISVEISNFDLQRGKQPVAKINKIKIKPGIISLLTGNPKINSLEIDGGLITGVKKEGYCNYCELIDSKERSTPDSASVNNPSTRYRQLVSLFTKLPNQININNLRIKYQKENRNYKVSINNFEKNKGEIEGLVVFREDHTTSKLKIKGYDFDDDLTGKIELYPYATQDNNLKVPILENMFGLQCRMEKASIKLNSFSTKNHILFCNIEGSVQGLELMHPKISENKIIISDLRGNINGKVGKGLFQIDSTSNIQLNDLNTKIYSQWRHGKNYKISFQLKTQKTKAENFISSLPEGAFENLKGIKARGELSWFLKLDFDSHQPEKCQFYSEMNEDDFQITRMGKTNLAKMNQPFLHTVSQDGKPIRSFMVGPTNSNYTPIEEIPFSMQQAVMYSEDAGFYSHKGFYLNAFRESIVQNFKKGKFARGGSTISMQLVKNVFLNHRKTLTRKAEEIFITWIIENKKITSKKRMMEVYLNVIEFGNNIWGIGEASRYYFGKHPSQLTNKECVFIASLVPRPRVYQHLIQSDGTVSPNNWNFTAIQNRFLGKGILSKDDTSRLLPTLRFKLRHNLTPEIEEENPDQINLEIFE